jgi:hypothetical protein
MAATPHPGDRFYPDALARDENALIAERRRHAGTPPGTPRIGLALSGGGIRSATFSLGLVQGLAKLRLLRRVDVLSTVSGGGYFGSFLGAAFSRDGGSVDQVEAALANNHSWEVAWLRDNGRFLSPNGAGDNWQAAAVALRNWVSLQIVGLTFCFLLLSLGALGRAGLCAAPWSASWWLPVERFFWAHPAAGLWWSPWLLLPLVPFALLMFPTGAVYWLTQSAPLMAGGRRLFAVVRPAYRDLTDREFMSRAQIALTRAFTLGVMATVALLGCVLIDSLGQTVYLAWSQRDFAFPTSWTATTGAGALAFGFAKKLAVLLERRLGARHVRIPTNAVALLLASVWLLLIIVALSVVVCGIAWRWELVSNGVDYRPIASARPLLLAVAFSFVASWVFSRSFGFVNLSSMQQMYAARLARAYLGATNPARRRQANHDMTDLVPGDEIALEDYAPHRHGGPLHLINVTVNETLSGKTQIERRDRKGVAMAVGPCGLSVGLESHASWSDPPPPATRFAQLQALWERHARAIRPLEPDPARFHALAGAEPSEPRRIEALAVGRWVAISGAAFTTGTGATTNVGLSLLLGLANVRLGYWWDSGLHPASRRTGSRPNLMERLSRAISRVLPVQMCLLNEFLARFHGPARRHWYLSDGGHFENTACYELIRRRVPFIICSDAGQDPQYEFTDFANLVRKARTDFNAEIQVVRRVADLVPDDPGVACPLPRLEDLVHPARLEVIGAPEDFPPLAAPGDSATPPRPARRHALLARIHYLDTHEFGWLLLVKPSLMGDESPDVVQYQRDHPLFPQEPTTDQYFDEAQWESYRKLGEHIAVELFTPPASPSSTGVDWSPADMVSPRQPTASGPNPAHDLPAAG